MIVQVQPTDKIKLGMVDPIALITLPILVDGHQSIFITHIYIYIHIYIYACIFGQIITTSLFSLTGFMVRLREIIHFYGRTIQISELS
jgi:hypothetical protein